MLTVNHYLRNIPAVVGQRLYRTSVHLGTVPIDDSRYLVPTPSLKYSIHAS
jgi:hypothetical protein